MLKLVILIIINSNQSDANNESDDDEGDTVITESWSDNWTSVTVQTSYKILMKLKGKSISPY